MLLGYFQTVTTMESIAMQWSGLSVALSLCSEWMCFIRIDKLLESIIIFYGLTEFLIEITDIFIAKCASLSMTRPAFWVYDQNIDDCDKDFNFKKQFLWKAFNQFSD